MALEIKGLQRVFKFKKDSMELVLDDPNSELSVNEVMDFYSMTYHELTTATVYGPEWEDDKAVYRFKTTIGVKGYLSIDTVRRSKNLITLTNSLIKSSTL